MKGQFLKKTIAGLMALLIVSGGMPLQPVSKIFERTAITAKATNIAPTPITGLVAEKNEYDNWKSQALVNAGEYDEVSDFNYWYSVKLIEIYDDTMSDKEKDFEIFEYNAVHYYTNYTTSIPEGNYPGKYKVYYGISDTDYVENPSSFEVIITKEGTVIPSESVSESGQGASSTEPTGGTGPTGPTEASTIVSTTVENGIYTGFIATSGTNGTSTSEGYAKLVDGNKSTKWCIVDPNNTCYVEFNSDISFIPTGYILTTGGDNSKYTGRNPAGWKLYGKLNENDDWTVLAEVTQDTVLEDKDNQSYDFDIKDNTSAYQYFRFEFSQTKDSNVFQLSELQFKGEAVEEATDPTEPSSENASEPAQTLVSVTYLDENGTEQTVDAIPLDGTETTLSAGIYVVNKDITYQALTKPFMTSDDVKIILMDGKTLSIGTKDKPNYGIKGISGSTLSIYGQEKGTGTMNVYSAKDCSVQYRNLNVFGGTLNAVSTSSVWYDYAIEAGNVELKNCIVTAEYENNAAIHITGEKLTIDNADVTIKGRTDATLGELKISNSTVTSDNAFSIAKNITVFDSTVTINGLDSYGLDSLNGGEISITNSTVTANTKEYALATNSNMTITDSTVTASSANSRAVEGSNVTITNSKVKAESSSETERAILAYKVLNLNNSEVETYCANGYAIDAMVMNINGGKITAKGAKGFYGYQTNINLKTADDFVLANSYYNDSVVIADGQVLTDGTNFYYGTLTSEQISALAGKTLTKADSVPVSYVDVDKRIMTLPLYSTANAGYIDISTPYLDGYTYKCLTVNGEECADMLEVIAKAKAILKDNPEANITIAAVYEQNAEKFIVTVTGGTLDSGASGDSFQVGTELTVTADSAEEGFQFDHWENNGKIASYNEVYSFHVPSKDVTLNAVYSTVGTEVEKVGTAFIESVTTIDNNKIAFVSKVSVPEGARILKAGIVANTEANLNGSELTADTAKFVRYENSKCYDYLTYKFTWTKSNVSESDIWCVRSYLVYRDENGEEQTVYGELVKASLNGVITEKE